MDYKNCPNCGKSVFGFFVTNDIIPQSKTDLINKQKGTTIEAFCTSCSTDLLNQIGRDLRIQKSKLQSRLSEIIHNIPILSSPPSVKWDYEVIGMVSTQTTSGTGFATEMSRSFNDFFGKGSNTTNRKVEAATRLCQAELRLQCIRAGGNCVVSTDIDFNEIGTGSTNMLMVCMAGTAIRITDLSNANIKGQDKIQEVLEITEQLDTIE